MTGQALNGDLYVSRLSKGTILYGKTLWGTEGYFVVVEQDGTICRTYPYLLDVKDSRIIDCTFPAVIGSVFSEVRIVSAKMEFVKSKEPVNPVNIDEIIDPVKMYPGQCMVLKRWVNNKDHSWVNNQVIILNVMLPYIDVVMKEFPHTYRFDTRRVEFNYVSASRQFVDLFERARGISPRWQTFECSMLPFDQLELNKIVTIHSWNDGDFSWRGDPMLITNIYLPYVEVKIKQHDKTVILDTRVANFQTILETTQTEELRKNVKIGQCSRDVRIIDPKDIYIGQCITVYRWNKDDNSYKGDQMVVKSINLPKITVLRCKPYWSQICSNDVVLDTNEVRLMEIKPFNAGLLKGVGSVIYDVLGKNIPKQHLDEMIARMQATFGIK